MLKKNCVYCNKLFSTPYLVQRFCGESCRVYWLRARQKNQSILEFREASLKEHIEKVKKYDKVLGEWKEAHPITILEGGEISIFGKPPAGTPKKAT